MKFEFSNFIHPLPLYLEADGQVHYIFGKCLRASTRWCIHLRLKIEFHGDQNMRWYKITFAWRRALEIQGHGVVGLLHGILE